MTKTYRLKTLAEMLVVATTLTKSWFRGHSRAVGALVPRFFRPEHRHPIVQMFRPDLEASTIEAFKRHAFMVSDLRLPANDDRLGWLCVMQHYRTPTRLLDWTENACVALYFAVSADGDQDGELWAMLPWALNDAGGAGWGIPLASDSPHVRYLLLQPYSGASPEKLAEKVGLKAPIRGPLAIEPPLLFPRMAVQSSTFTIHPSPDGTRTIVESLPEPAHLVRYIIPASSKAEMLGELRVLAGPSHEWRCLFFLDRPIPGVNRIARHR